MNKLFGLAALLIGLVLLSQAGRLLMVFYDLGVMFFWAFAVMVFLWVLTSAGRRGWALDIMSGIFLTRW